MRRTRGLPILTQGRWQCLCRARTLCPLLVRQYEMGEYLKSQSEDYYSGTMAEVVAKIRQRAGVEIGYHVVPKTREHLLKYQPKPEQLPARSLMDSYTVVTLPLSDDEAIRQIYINHHGRVRMGRLMEDMDMFAVWLCHRHVEIPDLPEGVHLPYTFVTLLVDRVELTNILALQVDKDIELSGFVSWVGRTSMEITIYFRQLLNGEYLNVTKALFLMVARNATNTGPAPVNTIKPADEREQRYWEEADLRQKKRKRQMAESVFLTPPLEHEQAIIYSLLKKTTDPNSFEVNKRVLPPKCHWMENTQHTTILNPFPENRNSHNTIFGGYLMRQAVEISFIAASTYIKATPILKCISDISFLKPVKVTAFLQLTAYVVYTSENFLQMMTIAQKFNVGSDKKTTTNVFYLTYQADKTLDIVMPASYHEMLWYIHGRRKFMTALKLELDFPLPVQNNREGDALVTGK